MLAESLHTPVYELKRSMPISEYRNWMAYYERQNKERETQEKLGGKKNLLDNPTDLVKGLTQ
jgi:hypothetical protein